MAQNSAHAFGSRQSSVLLLPDSLVALGLDPASARKIGLQMNAVLREQAGQQGSPSMLVQPKRSRLFGEQRVPEIK